MRDGDTKRKWQEWKLRQLGGVIKEKEAAGRGGSSL